MVCGPFEGHLGRPQGEVGFGKFGKVALAMWTWRLGEWGLDNRAICTPYLAKYGKQKNSHVDFTIWQREQKQAQI
jgi:hypothetical protein